MKMLCVLLFDGSPLRKILVIHGVQRISYECLCWISEKGIILFSVLVSSRHGARVNIEHCLSVGLIDVKC
jgi:hypothetical protein